MPGYEQDLLEAGKDLPALRAWVFRASVGMPMAALVPVPRPVPPETGTSFWQYLARATSGPRAAPARPGRAGRSGPG